MRIPCINCLTFSICRQRILKEIKNQNIRQYISNRIEAGIVLNGCSLLTNYYRLEISYTLKESKEKFNKLKQFIAEMSLEKALIDFEKEIRIEMVNRKRNAFTITSSQIKVNKI